MCTKDNVEEEGEGCVCDVDFDGAGYTYSDEYGPCPYCLNEIEEINEKIT